MNKKKQEAGRRGGLATLAKYGRVYFEDIGKKGAEVTHSRYRLEPVDLNDFVMVHRETGKAVARLSGAPVQEGV